MEINFYSSLNCFVMKHNQLKYLSMLLFATLLFFAAGCKKEVSENQKLLQEPDGLLSANKSGNLKQAKTFSSEVIIKWLNLQLDLLRVPLAPGTGSQAAERAQAYCGIAAYEAVVNGMPAYQSLYGQLNNFPLMSAIQKGKAYHWAACVNAALAEMNRKLFPTTADANKTKINTLENELATIFAGEADAATIQRSVAFGKDVAAKVFAWAAGDGFANVNTPYVPPVGPGLWVPTAPTPPVNPYAYQRRLLVPGVADGTAPAPPPAYSEVPGSPFWNMVKDVYDKSLVLTEDQKAMAIYHRDAPGYPGGGHFVAVLAQVFSKAKPSLATAALCYAKVGIAQCDATVLCFTTKYHYNLVRPITYIRNVMGHSTWSPLIPTPNHPEFSSAHAVNSSAVATMLTNVFGDNFQFTLHTYDYLGLPARNYNSFDEMTEEMANSRVFGGIHYQASCDKGRMQGRKIATNILKKLKFKKDDDEDDDDEK
jgi:hypothetical protein